MINLIQVSNLQELCDDLKQIYIDSFPSDERREWHELKELTHDPHFSLNQVFDNQKLIGLISIWDLQEFIFIEHFAIEKSVRSKGIGSHVLKQIIEAKSVKVVVEVEPPTNKLTKRRITFYERLGFSACESSYWQPPYSPDKNKVKMLLMSFPDKILPLEFIEIKKQLYWEVYQFNDSRNFQ